MKQKKNRFEERMTFHQPVLLKEAIDFLKIKPGEKYIDCTVGGAGHTRAILEKGGRVFGFDRDPEAVSFANKHLKVVCPIPKRKVRGSNAGWQIVRGDFVNLEEICQKYQIHHPAGILLDLGVSSHQLEAEDRGFSFSKDELLDMRMDPQLAVSAADLINALHKGELNELFSHLGEEKLALPITQAIVLARRAESIRTTKQLADIVSGVYRKKYRQRGKIHPATKVFLALRIAVNDELNNLKKVLPQAIKILKTKGRLVVISFHGLEDRIVKSFFKKGGQEGWLAVLNKKPVVPSEEEVRINPRARSAKLRAGEKI